MPHPNPDHDSAGSRPAKPGFRWRRWVVIVGVLCVSWSLLSTNERAQALSYPELHVALAEKRVASSDLRYVVACGREDSLRGILLEKAGAAPETGTPFVVSIHNGYLGGTAMMWVKEAGLIPELEAPSAARMWLWELRRWLTEN